MSDDKYQLCPCGSGKKLKFCCYETHRTLCVSDEDPHYEPAIDNRRVILALQPGERLNRANSSGRFLCRQISGSSILIADGGTGPLFTIAVMPVMPMSVYACFCRIRVSCS